MNICVFCSANELDKRYTKPTKKLGELIAKAGHTLVWGGNNMGLMKTIADAVSGSGGKMIGISMERLKHLVRPGADEMFVAKNLSERKTLLQNRSDAFIVLPGGLGTLDEVTEMLELKKHDFHDKKIIILNVANFYDSLRQQLCHMEEEGFLPMPLSSLVTFVDTPDAAIAIL